MQKVGTRIKSGFASNKRQILLYALIGWLFFSAVYIIVNGNLLKVQKSASSSSTIPNTADIAAVPTTGISQSRLMALEGSMFPEKGFTFNASWGDSVKRLVENDALNASFLNEILNQSGQPLSKAELKIMNGTYSGKISINKSDSMFILYVLWGLGINNKNPIINSSILSYKSPYELASTGGYGSLGTLSIGNLTIITLNETQQSLAASIAANVYRPCCNNPAMFPDCNHGAAQLALIELMASQGRNQTQIYNALKDFNSFYYPQQYLEAAIFFNSTQGKAWNGVAAKQLLSYNFSSASGYSALHRLLLSNNLLPSVSGAPGSSCGV